MTNDDWKCHGWEDHEIFHLETGRRMSFRAKLQWLEGADRMVRLLARQRRWIDKDGVIHEATENVKENVHALAVAEEQTAYRAGPEKRGSSFAKATADKEGTPPTA
jgi:hypothetical protein